MPALMSLLGLIATWIPAQRALHVDALMLLREELGFLAERKSVATASPGMGF
jgi:hypothetical protein